MPMIDLSNTVNFPSAHNMHKWGGANIGRLAAPQIQSTPITPRTLRSVTLSHPLSSMSDEVIKAPCVYARIPANARIMSLLSGCGDNSPRLSPYDRTRHQRAQDLSRPTCYSLDYCRPASVRSPMRNLPPLEARDERAAAIGFVDDSAMSQRDLYRTARFGMKLPSNVGDGPVGHPGMAAHLDPMYNPAQHGLRASVRPKTWQGKGPDPGY
jgi:hypothetical protein